ncbi:MAG: tripartite tricarboxylate transporter substrate binding protein [Betaproteobacteria bacterium]|nr:tripartite tricarboxylate transporter substrate binding protein [Betaproteobacteria bacterium]
MVHVAKALAAACVVLGALSAPVMSWAQTAGVQAWPNRPIRLVSPFPPGGTTDQIARLVQPALSQSLGVPVVVENRSGGNGSIGTGMVAKAAPDGHTFVVVFDTHGTNPSLIPNMGFDTRTELAPVMLIATGAMVITVHKSQTQKSFGDLIKSARTTSAGVPYGTIGSGSLAQLAMTSLAAQVGFPMTHVPYKGGGPLAADALAGHVPVAMATTALLSPHIRSGALVPLAVTSAQRDPALPDVPTLAEQGVKDFEALAWWGVFAPAGTPADIISRINRELSAALSEPTVRTRLTGLGMNLQLSQPMELGTFLDSQITRWAKVIREFNIRAGD